MKRTASKIALCLFVGLVALPGLEGRAGLAFADATPTKTVEMIVQSIKTAGNASGVVDFVNWRKAYEQLSDPQKQQLGIDSPEKMKVFFKEMLASPSAAIKKQMEARLQAVPADKQAAAKQSLEQIDKMMQQKEIEMKERITGTEYKVSDEKITGNTATVKLTQTFKGETKTEDVKLEKEGDAWLLPTLNSLGNQQPGPGAQAPVGAPAGAPPAAAVPAPSATAAAKKK